MTEQEVVRGVLNAKDREEHTLAFFRHIENINISLLRHSMKFIDIIAKQIDEEAQRMLSDLRDVRVIQDLIKYAMIQDAAYEYFLGSSDITRNEYYSLHSAMV